MPFYMTTFKPLAGYDEGAIGIAWGANAADARAEVRFCQQAEEGKRLIHDETVEVSDGEIGSYLQCPAHPSVWT